MQDTDLMIIGEALEDIVFLLDIVLLGTRFECVLLATSKGSE